MTIRSRSSESSRGTGGLPPVPPADDPFGSGGRGGDLVRVAVARHLSEAEFIQNLLAAEGIPSVIRRSPGADVPDFLAAGARDLLVRRRDEIDAREALLQTGDDAPSTSQSGPRWLAPALFVAAMLVVLLVVALLI